MRFRILGSERDCTAALCFCVLEAAVTGASRRRGEFTHPSLCRAVSWLDSQGGTERCQRGIHAAVLLPDQTKQVMSFRQIRIESQSLNEFLTCFLELSAVGELDAGIDQSGYSSRC